MSLGIALRPVRVPATGHGRYEERDEGQVFVIAVRVPRRTEEDDIHCFDCNLLPMDGVLDSEDGREEVDIVNGQPVGEELVS